MFRLSRLARCASGAAAAAASTSATAAPSEVPAAADPAEAGPSTMTTSGDRPLCETVTDDPETFALAMRVKQHCTISLSKFQSGHPQLFLHRGRAYLELGLPFFAAPDFQNAAEHIPIGNQHEILVREALKHIPKEQVAYFESADNHIGLLVKPFLGKGVAMQKAADGKGRGVFATEPLQAGDVVVKRTAQAWLTYPLKDGHCAACGSEIGVRTFACKNPDCHEEYCSRECRQNASQTYHAAVCTNKDFQSLELELYNNLKTAPTPSDYNTAAVFLLLLRVYGVSMAHKIIPSVLPQMRTLSGRLMFSAETLATDTLDFYTRLTRITGTKTTISYEEFICTLAKLTGNIFQEEDFICAHVVRSMLNHSCDPNVVDTGGELVMTRPAEVGEELCISYYPALNTKSFKIRDEELKNRGFFCACPKCLAKK
jgi:hypothetical protein